MTTNSLTGATAQGALATQLNYNGGVLAANIDGITHEESLAQPESSGNCLNWVLGHIVANRNALLVLVGNPPIWSEAEAERYQRGGEPITEAGEGVLELSKIVADFNTSQAALLESLGRMTASDLNAPAGQGESDTGTALAGLVFHETYHLGQIGLLRRVIGREGAIR